MVGAEGLEEEGVSDYKSLFFNIPQCPWVPPPKHTFILLLSILNCLPQTARIGKDNIPG